ncbi:MAG: hypothetical protein CVU11_09585 [Bacteroidetes bacterium HGW-Bacteroidetes-6]|jgi:hypothetical protein|nr:MAG: hypothetical protein CVU11_09585 [Bacteroidetes bacterium HGW-Bacteroidetes-6]
MKKIFTSVLLLFRHLLPSAHLRFLLGSWIIAAGLVSCGSSNSGKTDKDTLSDKDSPDTTMHSCYAKPVDNVSDSLPKTCYAAAIDPNRDKEIE